MEQKDLYRALMERRAKEYLVAKLMEVQADAQKRTDTGENKKRKRVLTVDTHAPPAKKLSTIPPPPTTSENQPTFAKSQRKRRRNDYRELSEDEWLDKLENEALYHSDSDASTNDDPIHSAYEAIVTQATKEINSKKLQNLVMQLRLACNSPHLFYWPWSPSDTTPPDSTLISASGKMLLLDTLLPALFSRGHKVLIFSQFTQQLDILEEYASTLRNWPVARIDGGVKLEDRRVQIKRFNEDPDWRLFLLSTRAGGLGINLTSADTVILFDSDWNPQMDLQAMDRAHRIGQKRSVIVYRFATAGTVEEVLLEKADAKRRLERLVIQKGKFKGVIDTANGVESGSGGVGKAGRKAEEELEGLLMKEDFEKVEVVGEGDELLSKEELEVLLDRSTEAYERAERGEERSVLGKGRGGTGAGVRLENGGPGGAEEGGAVMDREK